MSILRCIRVRKIELDTKCNIAEVALELKQRYVDLLVIIYLMKLMNWCDHKLVL